MTLPTPIQTTTIPNTIISRHAQDHIPEDLWKEFLARRKALNVTEQLIIDHIAEGMDQPVTKPANLVFTGSRWVVQFRATIKVDGQYRQEIPGNKTGHIDYTTMNLLLNNKILTMEEKRQLLKDRNLLPEVEGKAAKPD